MQITPHKIATFKKLSGQPSCCFRNFPELIDTVSNLVFWIRFLNKLEPWHNVYIIKQYQNTLTLILLTDSNFLG